MTMRTKEETLELAVEMISSALDEFRNEGIELAGWVYKEIRTQVTDDPEPITWDSVSVDDVLQHPEMQRLFRAHVVDTLRSLKQE